MSSTQIYSKKTNAELIALTADVVSNRSDFDARVTAVDAVISEFQSDYTDHLANFDAEKLYRNAQKEQLDASLSAIEAQAVADKSELTSLIDTEKARVALREGAVDVSFSAVVAKAEADKAELIGSIATEKATLQANIDALASSSSGASGALTSRVDTLEAKVITNLGETVKSVLTDEIVGTTLNAFLARDDELSTAVNNAVADRVNADTAIKAKFDALVDTLFEGLTFEGVTKASLKFSA